MLKGLGGTMEKLQDIYKTQNSWAGNVARAS